jgi:CheY-like chemotaxis protein
MADIRKVLMVDDEPDIRKIGQISLAHVGGWEVVLAASGPEGLEAARRERPDLILLDVMMPGMDGPATLAALRAEEATRDIPVIFMTAKAQRAELERYVALGARAVIVKPFDPMSLPDEIRKRLAAP